MKPVKCYASYATGGSAVEEEGVGNGVKGCGYIKEDEH